MKKSTKTLLALLSIASLVTAGAMNAVHTIKTGTPLYSRSADAIYATTQQLLGKNGVNGVHFAKGGTLIERPAAYDESVTDKNIAEIAKFAKSDSYTTVLAIVPTAFEILRYRLDEYSYNDWQQRIYERLHISFDGTHVTLCDPCDTLTHYSEEYIYYRTDPHLTSLGSYYVYKALSEYLGFTPYPLSEFDRETVTTSFRGATFDKAASLLAKKDTIEKFILPGSTYQSLRYAGALHDSIYTDDTSGYSVFLGGDRDLTHITSDNGSDKKLAVIKDSYANSIVPFLANHYGSVHVIDTEYYKGDLRQYLIDNNITEVLVLYGADTLNTGNIKLTTSNP